MALRNIQSGLRTIHNGSNGVAKVSLVVPAGDELTVSDYVAEQLQRDGSFKDGATPEAMREQIAAAEKEAAAASADQRTDSEREADENAATNTKANPGSAIPPTKKAAPAKPRAKRK